MLGLWIEHRTCRMMSTMGYFSLSLSQLSYPSVDEHRATINNSSSISHSDSVLWSLTTEINLN